MKKQVTVLFIAAAVLAVVLAAGCSSQTASPTPSPSTVTSAASSTATGNATASIVKIVAPTALPNSTNLSSFWTSYLPSQGYTVVTGFERGVNNTTEQYFGVVTDGTSNYTAAIQVDKSSTDTANAFSSLTSSAQQQGFVPLQTNSTTWIGYNSRYGYAYVSQDTSDHYVILLAPTSIGST